MAVFDQLVDACQPTLAIVEHTVTEGTSWSRTFGIELIDDDGTVTPVPLTGVTILCRAYDENGATLVTLASSVSGASSNIVTISAAPSDTAGKGGTSLYPRPCPWEFKLTNGAGRVATVWGTQDSFLKILQAA